MPTNPSTGSSPPPGPTSRAILRSWTATATAESPSRISRIFAQNISLPKYDHFIYNSPIFTPIGKINTHFPWKRVIIDNNKLPLWLKQAVQPAPLSTTSHPRELYLGRCSNGCRGLISRIPSKITAKIWAMASSLAKLSHDTNPEGYQCMPSKTPKTKVEEITIGDNFNFSSKNIRLDRCTSHLNNMPASWHKKITNHSNCISSSADCTPSAPKEIFLKMHLYSMYLPPRPTTPIWLLPICWRKTVWKNWRIRISWATAGRNLSRITVELMTNLPKECLPEK